MGLLPPKLQPGECSVCHKIDLQTVHPRYCVYEIMVNDKEVPESICDNCEYRHAMAGISEFNKHKIPRR